MSFWNKLKKPIFVLAPMADVTDAAFRFIIAKYSKYGGADIAKYGKSTPHLQASGGPDVMWTEFVSADGLMLAPEEGRRKLMKDLMYTEAERPIVAQFFTSRPEIMKKTAELACKLGFDGIDINMGCPDRGIERQGAGAAMIKNPKLAREIIRAAKDGGGGLPISIKTRIGYNKNQLDEWLPELLAEEPAVVTVHARTRKEMSKVRARWEEVKHAVEIRNKLNSKTLILGNGDVMDLIEAKKRVEETGCDGIMLGKAIFGRPYLFSNSRELENRENPEVVKKILEILVEHTKLFETLLGDTKSFAIMKKHFKAYVEGFDGAKELRVQLMECNDASEVEKTIITYLAKRG